MIRCLLLGIGMALLCSGCHRRNSNPYIPGIHKYANCKEISTDAKNHTVTVICPIEQ